MSGQLPTASMRARSRNWKNYKTLGVQEHPFFIAKKFLKNFQKSGKKPVDKLVQWAYNMGTNNKKNASSKGVKNERKNTYDNG